jgi:PIN domain nuclease of toxin-antitoxin system
VSERLLLDTHVFLWWKENNPALGIAAREAIATADIVYLSAASAWEIAIKSGLGKIRIPGSVADAVVQSGFIELAIQFSHAAAVELLPQHHTDPFDRMIAAQSKVEKLVLITHDRHFEPYGLPIIWT